MAEREKDLEGNEITIHTIFKWADYPDMNTNEIRYPSFQGLVKKEFKRLESEIEELKKIVGSDK